MKRDPLKKGVLIDDTVGIGPVPREMMQTRAREMAAIADRGPLEVREASATSSRVNGLS